MPRHGMRGIAAVVALLLVLAGCGGPANEDGPVTLTVSVWNLDDAPEFQALFDAFERANPDVTIEPVEILADDYADKVTTMLSGGDSTDVITMKEVTDYARFATRGQLADLTDLAKSDDMANLEGLDAYEVDGTYFAVPFRQDFWLLYYNKTYFDQAGLPYPDGISWDEYVDLAKKLTGDQGGKQVYGTYHHTWRSVVQAVAAAQTGGDQLSGEYDFFRDQYEVAVGLQKDKAALDYGTMMAQTADYRTMFETGATAMLPMGTWYIPGLREAKAKGDTGVEWSIAPMPQRKAGSEVTTFGAPTAFGVNGRAEHPETATKFVEFAASAAGADAVTKAGVVPARQTQESIDAYFALDGMPTDPLSKKAFQPDKIGLEMPVSEQTSDVDSILQEEHELIMIGDKSIEDGIRSMGERVRDEVR